MPCSAVLCRSTRAHSMGDRVSATKPEMATDVATVMPNCGRAGGLSVRNASGRNTATVETVAATTANEISSMPRRAASIGGRPSSIQRVMFSSTTIASSTTRPIASVSPISVSVLIDAPTKWSTANVPTSEIGIATDGMRVARSERRNRKITTTTRAMASKIDSLTSRSERSMNTDVSNAASKRTPSGSVARRSSTSAFTAAVTSSVFAFDCLTMPSPTAGLALKRTSLRSSSAPTSTCATSRKRTGAPSISATIIAP